MVENISALNGSSAAFSSKHHNGAHWVAVEDKSESAAPSTTRTLNKIAKVIVGVIIFFAVAYGEGIVHWLALFALLVVYLVAVG